MFVPNPTTACQPDMAPTSKHRLSLYKWAGMLAEVLDYEVERKQGGKSYALSCARLPFHN